MSSPRGMTDEDLIEISGIPALTHRDEGVCAPEDYLVAALARRVAALTSERDEARAERDDLLDPEDTVGRIWQERAEKAEAERDQALGEIEAELDQARALIEDFGDGDDSVRARVEPAAHS